jgi:hypothetical protein
VQFRPVWVECPGKELVPEGAKLGEGFCMPDAAVRRGRKGSRSDRSHDAASVFRSRLLPREVRFLGAEDEFSPDLLKDGFNCRDLAHTWCPTRIHPW